MIPGASSHVVNRFYHAGMNSHQIPWICLSVPLVLSLGTGFSSSGPWFYPCCSEMIVDIYQYVSVCLSIDLYLYVYLYCVALFHLISLFDVILPINFLLCQLGKFWGNARNIAMNKCEHAGFGNTLVSKKPIGMSQVVQFICSPLGHNTWFKTWVKVLRMGQMYGVTSTGRKNVWFHQPRKPRLLKKGKIAFLRVIPTLTH